MISSRATDTGHYSVLLNESLDGLNIKPDGIYIDATFGRGGHSRAILERMAGQGQLIAIDQDPEAIEYAKKHFTESNFKIVHASFAELEQIADELGVLGRVDGLLLDLGVSSPQLDEAERGFSFMRDGPLDMRMNPSQGLSAKDWLAEVDEKTLALVLKNYGEERFAFKIARAVSHDARLGLINTTRDLATLIERVSPKKEKHKHAATRSFQAIRIHINQELEVLKTVLEASVKVLSSGGRLSVISFHSLEDRIVKHFMRDQSRVKDLFPGSPVFIAGTEPVLKVVGKPCFPSEQECDENPRSRSAVLRIAERV
ncbi:16S rRNA (cytosine(1402)-N(4))-methyltransferase RsmH [Thiomicrospira microaerophila]|uniref:16S rRNA (cytosine(1402)-N(4))-methyltransferase RsmH n=1 Tax=Thiomicrospira microaerophila TaxID=406020 RepID=UPI00200FB777|nr:16S rRNA (cytosine(1402)-N(4))-methyltransferase RsmH [Thiomicrospira microaerophila]UQB42630.1 16S rRNA (cytosine(1402)-N(4))-methyltransferase RsmH [Thiomicrospira microaerophila]